MVADVMRHAPAVVGKHDLYGNERGRRAVRVGAPGKLHLAAPSVRLTVAVEDILCRVEVAGQCLVFHDVPDLLNQRPAGFLPDRFQHVGMTADKQASCSERYPVGTGDGRQIAAVHA